MNLNKVFLIGRLTADPELKSTNSGTQVVNFSLATNRMWDRDGVKQEETEFHNVVFYGRQAEVIARYCKKSSVLLVEGRLHRREWEKNGEKRHSIEIVGEQMQLGQKQ